MPDGRDPARPDPAADPRIGAFAGLVGAVDRADPRAGLGATRGLRRFGYSAHTIGPFGQGVQG